MAGRNQFQKKKTAGAEDCISRIDFQLTRNNRNNGRAGIIQTQGNKKTGQNRYAGRNHPHAAPFADFLGQEQPAQGKQRNQDGNNGENPLQCSPHTAAACSEHIQKEYQAVTNEHLGHHAFHFTVTVASALFSLSCHRSSLQIRYANSLPHFENKCNQISA